MEAQNTKKKIVFYVVEDKAFLIQRLNLALYVQSQGNEVHVLSNQSIDSIEIEKLDFIYHNSKTIRKRMNPLSEIMTVYYIYKTYKKIQPDVVHNISIKPVIYGTLAARLANVPRIVNLVNGLGFVFNENSGWKRKILRNIVLILYRLVLRSSKVHTIFQNPEDKKYFEDMRMTLKNNSYLILGSGVDTKKFTFKTTKFEGTLKFLFVSRMLWEKGIRYLIEAIKILKQENLNFEVWFVGEPDASNKTSVKLSFLEDCENQGLIKYLGFRDDIPKLLHETHVSILPTFYREGVPLSLIEAASSGNAIITTDMPGCREIVKDGLNGFIVPPKDAQSIADAMKKIIKNPDLAKSMGIEGRKRVEEMFSKEVVNKKTYEVYKATSNMVSTSPNVVPS